MNLVEGVKLVIHCVRISTTGEAASLAKSYSQAHDQGRNPTRTKDEKGENSEPASTTRAQVAHVHNHRHHDPHAKSGAHVDKHQSEPRDEFVMDRNNSIIVYIGNGDKRRGSGIGALDIVCLWVRVIEGVDGEVDVEGDCRAEDRAVSKALIKLHKAMLRGLCLLEVVHFFFY